MNNTHHWLLALLAGLLVTLGLACGPPMGTCGPTNCAGCCSTAGVCQGGTADAQCGTGGLACSACAQGQSCQLNRCAAGGTDAGTGGGGGTTCQVLNPISATRTNASYTNDTETEDLFGAGFSAATDPSDVLMGIVNFRLGTNATGATTGAHDLAQEPASSATCKYCVGLNRGCTDGANGPICTGGSYLARAGTMTVFSAPRMSSGDFNTSYSNLRFEEWDLENDVKTANGRCFTMTSAVLNAMVQ